MLKKPFTEIARLRWKLCIVTKESIKHRNMHQTIFLHHSTAQSSIFLINIVYGY